MFMDTNVAIAMEIKTEGISKVRPAEARRRTIFPQHSSVQAKLRIYSDQECHGDEREFDRHDRNRIGNQVWWIHHIGCLAIGRQDHR